MQLTAEQLQKNLTATLSELTQAGPALEEYRFTIVPIQESEAKHSSVDDYMRLTVLTDENIMNKLYDINDVVTLLSGPNSSYPLWIVVAPVGHPANSCVFELKTSMRFRKPSELKHKETGHPPFKAGREVDALSNAGPGN